MHQGAAVNVDCSNPDAHLPFMACLSESMRQILESAQGQLLCCHCPTELASLRGHRGDKCGQPLLHRQV